LCWFVYRLDENVAGIIEEGEFVEREDQDQGHFAEQGKLFSELALQTYASTFITCFTLKARFIKTHFKSIWILFCHPI